MLSYVAHRLPPASKRRNGQFRRKAGRCQGQGLRTPPKGMRGYRKVRGQFGKCIRRRLSELGLAELAAHRARMQGEPKG